LGPFQEGEIRLNADFAPERITVWAGASGVELRESPPAPSEEGADDESADFGDSDNPDGGDESEGGLEEDRSAMESFLRMREERDIILHLRDENGRPLESADPFWRCAEPLAESGPAQNPASDYNGAQRLGSLSRRCTQICTRLEPFARTCVRIDVRDEYVVRFTQGKSICGVVRNRANEPEPSVRVGCGDWDDGRGEFCLRCPVATTHLDIGEDRRPAPIGVSLRDGYVEVRLND
jgi:hypothetical protein